MKILQIILSALTTTGILITVFGENETVGIISAILSAILFTLNAYFQKYDLGEIAQKHSESASDIWGIREQYLSLLTDLNSGILNLEQASTKRDKLQNDLLNFYHKNSKFKKEKIEKLKNDFDILSVQRNLKILGIFVRLFKRDNKDNYLRFLPYTWLLIEKRLENPAFKNLKILFYKYLPIKKLKKLSKI